MPQHDNTGRPNRTKTTDPDASADWRTEYAAQGVAAEAFATDGGTEGASDTDTHRLPSPGDRVRDCDTADGDELVVVETHRDTKAADWWIHAINASVADANPAYDPRAPVVEAVYVSEAEDRLDGWREVEDLRDAVAFDAINVYSFPADRLAALPGGEGR
jgi:hypothetical protein